MNIVITEVIPGKYPKIKAGREQFNVKDASAFGVGKTYNVEYTERDVSYNGKNFKVKDITSYKYIGSDSPRGESIEKMAKDKNEHIARACALNNSCLLVDAFAKVWVTTDVTKGKSSDEISTMLRTMKHIEYLDNLKLLGIEPTDKDTVEM